MGSSCVDRVEYAIVRPWAAMPWRPGMDFLLPHTRLELLAREWIVARTIVNEYLAKERPGAAASEPMLQVQYKWYGGEKKVRRSSGQRVWKIIDDLGKRVGVELPLVKTSSASQVVDLRARSGHNRAS
jgi:hypothetical protein